jgi:hypothetical protein
MMELIAFVCLVILIGAGLAELNNTKQKRGGGILPTTNDEVCRVDVEPHSLLLPRIRKSRSHETFQV